MSLPKGKLGFADLERLVFRHLPRVEDPRTISLDFGMASTSGRLVAASDPVIGVPRQCYGYFAVHYSAADVAMAQAIPRYLILGVYYPPNTPESWLENNMRELGKEARRLNMQVLAGHTGGYDGLTLPIISTTCLGFRRRDAPPVRSIRENDTLLAVGPVGRETLWFLANVEPEKIKTVLSPSQQTEIATDLEPFAIAPLVAQLPSKGVFLIHDLTEGGVTTGLRELAQASQLGITIQYEQIPWDENALALFAYLKWEPLLCSSFGSFLAVTTHKTAIKIVQDMQRQGRPAAIIGKFNKKKGIRIQRDGKLRPLPVGEDPYKKLTTKLRY